MDRRKLLLMMAGGKGAIPIPTGWDWTLPFKVYKDSATGTFNIGSWDISAQVPRTGGSYYVSKSGNDTTGNGLSWDTAWKTVAKAITALVAVDYPCIYVGAGKYGYNECPWGINKNISIVGIGQVVIDSALPYTWSLVSGKTYTYTATYGGPCSMVFDWGTLDDDGYPTVYEKKTSADDVEGTPGSFYINTSAPYDAYIHTLDGTTPDADVRASYGVGIIGATSAVKTYIENIFFAGTRIGTLASGAELYAKDIIDIQTATALSITASTAFLQGCFFRGFFSSDSAARDLVAGGNSAKIAMIDCGGDTTGGSSYEGSNIVTNHDGRSVIIGGEFSNSYGPPIGLIKLAGTAQNWLLGVYSHHNLQTASNYYSYQLSGTSYLDTCRSSDSTKDIGGSGATVYVRDFTAGATSDATLVAY